MVDCPNKAIDDGAIEPVEQFAKPLRRFDKQRVVEFVDIVFVQQRRIQTAAFGWPSARGGAGLTL